MAEQNQDRLDAIETTELVEAVEAPPETTDTEKQLRSEVALYREQARLAQSERDAALAVALRERDDAIAAVQEEARGRVLQAELRTHAVRSGILDLDALKLAELDGVRFDEHGDVLGVEEVISALRERKPYLFSTETASPTSETTAQTQRAPRPAQPVVVDARELSRDAWRIERDRLLAGKR